MKKPLRIRFRKRPERQYWELFFVNPRTGQRQYRMTRAETRKAAELEANQWLSELGSSIDTGHFLSWEQFRDRFMLEKLASLSRRGKLAYQTALNQFEKHTDYKAPGELTASDISRVTTVWRAAGIADTTVAQYLRHVKAALRWAQRLGLINQVPHIEMPRIIRSRLAKGRPITAVEYKRILVAARSWFPGDAVRNRQLRRCIKGLWNSGLRLTEFFDLSWDEPPVLLDLHGGKYPRIIWHAAGHKARRDEITPIAPEFHRQLKLLALSGSTGKVFTPPCQIRDFSSLFKKVAKKAKVFVGSTYAGPHDFRRSFATRLAPRVRPVTLRAIMRHADIRTTLQYYVELDADDVGAELWK